MEFRGRLMEDNKETKLCDYCHINPATIPIWELTSNPPVEKTICEQCDKDLGRPNFNGLKPTSNIT